MYDKRQATIDDRQPTTNDFNSNNNIRVMKHKKHYNRHTFRIAVIFATERDFDGIRVHYIRRTK